MSGFTGPITEVKRSHEHPAGWKPKEPGVTGRLIAFEGGRGERQVHPGRDPRRAPRRAAHLRAGRHPARRASVRALLLDRATLEITPRAEALLMAADRAQHVAEVIRPALASGRSVVTDRYTGSSVAYQGYGRQLDPVEIANLSGWATEDLWPDLVVLLEVPPTVSLERTGGARDRLEAAGAGLPRAGPRRLPPAGHRRPRALRRGRRHADPGGRGRGDLGHRAIRFPDLV